MDLLLIDPVTTARTVPLDTRVRLRRGIGYPGLGLATVAALTPPEVRVRIIDEAVEEIDRAAPADLVGITVQGPAAPYAYELADRFRRRGTPVVLGGVHASMNPEEAGRHADALVAGEAEGTWPRLLEDFRLGRLEPLYRNGGMADLATSPRPRHELLRRERYRIAAVLQSSKGCPQGCEFCSLHAYLGSCVRLRPVARVLEEARSLPGRELLFIDDNFYADREHAAALLHGLRSVGKRWVAETTWQIAFDGELLALARASGCAGLFVGFDSIHPRPEMRKVPPNAEEVYPEAIRRVRAAGIPVVAAFVFGLDLDGPDVFDRSLRIVLRGGADLVNFSVVEPYPGTPIYRRLEAEGRITDQDWSHYISPTVCFRPRGFSAADLHRGVIELQREFYSLRRVAARALSALRRFGWAVGLFSVALNLAQKRNWGQGARAAGAETRAAKGETP